MGHIGNVFLIYSFIAGVAACLIFLLGKFVKSNFCKYGIIFKILHVLCLVVAIIVMVTAVFSDEFTLAYVSNYSDLTLPFFYKISVLWAGPEGFFLFLAAVFSIVGLAEVLRIRDKTTGYYNILCIITTIIPLCIVALLLFVLHPFREMDFTPVNGQGLTPLLQNISAFFYTPMWVLFLVSSFIVFSWGLTSLILKDYGIYWLRESSVWVYSIAIFITGLMCCEALTTFDMIYVSGFWGWDVMETASVILLIISIAFIHSVAVCLDKGHKKRLCLFLAFLVFQLGLFCIYIASAVETTYAIAFQRPPVKNYILIALGLSTVVFGIFYIKGFKRLKSLASVISRPKDRAVNIALSVAFAMAFFTFAGLMVQLYGLQTGGISFFDSEYYHTVTAFVIAFCISALGILALRLYRGKDWLKSHKFNLILILCVILGIGVLIFIFKIKVYVSIFLWLAAVSAILMVTYAVKTTAKHSFAGAFRNGELCTWTMVHLGFLLAATGVGLSASYYSESYVETTPGASFEASGYKFLVSGVNSLYKDNYLYTFVDISVEKDGTPLGQVSPEIRSYDNSRKLYAGVKNKRFFLNEISIAFISYDFKTKDVELFVTEYPYVWLIPFGVLLTILGTIGVTFGKRIFNGR